MRFIISVFMLCSLIFANNLADFKTLKGKFTQVVTNSNGKSINYSGEVFVKGNNILWKYKKPIEKNVFIKDNFVIVDEPEIEQAIFTNVSSELNLINMLNKAKNVSKDIYEVDFDNIVYSLKFKNKTLKSIKYKDHMDNTILIAFNDIKKDINVTDGIFEFNPPSYYDIIRK